MSNESASFDSFELNTKVHEWLCKYRLGGLVWLKSKGYKEGDNVGAVAEGALTGGDVDLGDKRHENEILYCRLKE